MLKDMRRSVCGNLLRVGKQENRAITLSPSTPCMDAHQFKDEELETELENGQKLPNGIKLVTNAWPD